MSAIDHVATRVTLPRWWGLSVAVSCALLALLLLVDGTRLSGVLAGPMYHLSGDDGLAIVGLGVGLLLVGLLLARGTPVLAIVALPLLVGPLYPHALPLLLGDEPHYLTIAESIAADGDLRVANQYAEGAVPAAQDAHLGSLDGVPSASGYSIHLPGAGAVAALGVLADSRRLALLPFAVALVLIGREQALLARALGARPRVATYASLLLLVTPPLLLLSRQVYPELLGGLCLVHLARRLAEGGPGHRRMTPLAVATSSLAAAAAPWFNYRYGVLAGLIVAGLAWRSRRAALPVMAALVVSSSLLLWMVHLWYGSFSPNAAYAGKGAFGGVDPRALVGFFTDSHVGLLFVAPVAFLALAWLPVVARARAAWALPVVLGIVVTIVSTSTYFDWASGGSTPGRFWASMLPLLAPLVALALTQRPLLVAVLGAIGGVASAALVAFPAAVYPAWTAALYHSRGDTTTRLWADVGLDWLPSLAPPGSTSTPVGLGLLVAGVVLAVWCRHAAWRRGRRLLAMAALPMAGAAVAAAGVALAISWAHHTDDELEHAAAQLPVPARWEARGATYDGALTCSPTCRRLTLRYAAPPSPVPAGEQLTNLLTGAGFDAVAARPGCGTAAVPAPDAVCRVDARLGPLRIEASAPNDSAARGRGDTVVVVRW